MEIISRRQISEAENWLKDKEYKLKDVPVLLAEYNKTKKERTPSNTVRAEKRIAFAIYYSEELEAIHKEALRNIKNKVRVHGKTDEVKILAAKAKMFLGYSKHTISQDVVSGLYNISNRAKEFMFSIRQLEAGEWGDTFSNYVKYKEKYDELKRKLGF